MPKSKRARVVHTSKLQKKTKEHNQQLYQNVQTCLSQYRYVYVLSVENMRNTYLKIERPLPDHRVVACGAAPSNPHIKGGDSSHSNMRKDVRTHFTSKGSRLFYGRSKVMAKALGHTPAEESQPGSHALTPYMTGDAGLLFSEETSTEVLSFCAEFRELDFARSGTVATRSFTIPEGVVYATGGEIPSEMDEPLAHSVEPQVRSLGMPTRLDKGKVMLDGEFEVCAEGAILDSRQTALLKMFGIRMAEFRVACQAWYDKVEERVEAVEEEKAEMES
ncbi:MAG: hypothetical protein Q9159_001118 [Coniocarpon cinnabarinum]